MEQYDVESLEAFKEMLSEERENVLEDFNTQKEELNQTLTDASGELSSMTYHMADVGTDMMEREKTSLFAHRQAKYLKEIESALERVEEKTYGVCTICSKLIEKERLMAVPIAKYHVHCKEVANQRKNN
jgi:DnaK suppressor protein